MKAARGMAEVLLEEGRAWTMARHMAELASREPLGELHGELAALRRFLGTEREVHFACEEADLFPVLAARGLEVEVGDARRQHHELRALREALARVPESSTAELRPALHRLSQALQRHIRYEADYLYRDVTSIEAAVFRDDVDRDLDAAAGAASPETSLGQVGARMRLVGAGPR
jgi:hypothetical protein